MKTLKNPVSALSVAAIAALLFASCATSPTGAISKGIADGTLTIEEARNEISLGANVGQSPLLEKAATAHRGDLVQLFVENGANVWESPSTARGKTFSLFTYVTDGWTNRKIFALCLAHCDDAPEIALPLISAFAERQRTAFINVMYTDSKKADSYGVLLGDIAESGVFDEETSKKYSPKEIRTDALRELVCGNGFHGYLARIETLLKSGADANAKTRDGESLLFVATANEWPNTIKALKNAGAVLAEGEAEKLEVLRRQAFFKAVRECDWEKITALKSSGFNLATEDEDGKNAFHFIAMSAYAELIDESVFLAFSTAGTNINKTVVNEDGTSFTPLSLAIESGNLRIAEFFLKYGANAEAEIMLAGKMGNFRQSLTKYALEIAQKFPGKNSARQKIAALIERAANDGNAAEQSAVPAETRGAAGTNQAPKQS